MRRWPAYTAWILTRALVLYWLIGPERTTTDGDLFYYQHSLDALHDNGIAQTLNEYPIPAFILLALPYLFLKLAHLTVIYPHLVATLALATDFVYLRFLLHSRKWHPNQPTWLEITAAEWTWILAVAAFGATTFARFDLIPGMLVGLAILYAVHRPNVAAVFGVLATGVKYWPAIVLPTLAAPADTRGRAIKAGVIAGGALGVVSLAVGGWERLISPLQYQGARGLQIESIFATPAMVHWAHDPHRYTVFYSSAKADEVSGPDVAWLLHLSSIATIVLAVVLVALWIGSWLRLRDPERSIDVMVWLILASVSGFIVTSKVFSPQYLLWMLPGAAAGLVVLRGHRSWNRLASWTMVLLAATLMTHEIYPRSYTALSVHTPESGAIVALLTMRNLMILGLCLYAVYESARGLVRLRPAAEASVEHDLGTVDA